MKEFSAILKEYSKDGYWMHSKTIPAAQWGNTKLAETYLQKYWLSSSEYEQKWKPIQERIFSNQNLGLPNMVFIPGFEVLVTLGGCLFVREEFVRLQQCAITLGERFLLVIENTFCGLVKEPIFRMKFPVDISWEELTSGNFASSIMLEMPHKDYFVFAESARWGKYSANDYEIPLDVFGFRKNDADVFTTQFEPSEAEWQQIAKCLPQYTKPLYRRRVYKPYFPNKLHKK